jgi:hypothetical protein
MAAASVPFCSAQAAVAAGFVEQHPTPQQISRRKRVPKSVLFALLRDYLTRDELDRHCLQGASPPPASKKNPIRNTKSRDRLPRLVNIGTVDHVARTNAGVVNEDRYWADFHTDVAGKRRKRRTMEGPVERSGRAPQ